MLVTEMAKPVTNISNLLPTWIKPIKLYKIRMYWSWAFWSISIWKNIPNMYKNVTDPIVLAWLCMWESGNRCFRFVSWLIFSNLAFQTILIQYLMSDKTNPQIQILTITEIKSKSGIFVQFQMSLVCTSKKKWVF